MPDAAIPVHEPRRQRGEEVVHAPHLRFRVAPGVEPVHRRSGSRDPGSRRSFIRVRRTPIGSRLHAALPSNWMKYG